MNRRHFLSQAGLPALIGLSSSPRAASLTVEAPLNPWDPGTGRPVRIGIVGAENSHTVAFAKAFNIEKHFPGVEVVAVWGETQEFAQRASERGRIPKIVQDPAEFLGIVDAVIIDHRHAKHHAAAARPFIEAGLPTFVDKPFTYRSEEARELLELATARKTPISCLSTAAYGPSLQDMAAQVADQPEMLALILTGPADISSKYGGISFYGIHMVEQLFGLLGDDVEAVRATRMGSQAKFDVRFHSGRFASLFVAPKRQVFCLTAGGTQEIQSRVQAESGLYVYAAIVKMFQTGQEPRSHASIFRTVALLEAMDLSLGSESWQFPAGWSA